MCDLEQAKWAFRVLVRAHFQSDGISPSLFFYYYFPGLAPLGTGETLHLGCLYTWPFKSSFLPLALALALGRWYLLVPRKCVAAVPNLGK